MARANTIRRRKNKRKIMDLIKANILLKLGLTPSKLRKGASEGDPDFINSGGKLEKRKI